MGSFQKLLVFLARPQVRSILLWIIAAHFAEMFIRNGVIKFDPEGFWTIPFTETWGFPLWFLYLIGVLEVLGGIILLVPRYRHIGSFVLALVMIGALCTRITFGLINGTEGSNLYEILQKWDFIFFVSTIAVFLYFMAIKHSNDEILRQKRTINGE